MNKDLTIGQFFAVLAESLVVVDSLHTADEVVCMLLDRNKIFPCNQTDYVKVVQTFSIYFEDIDTYLPFQKGEIRKVVDLRELISYALKGECDLMFAKSLSM